MSVGRRHIDVTDAVNGASYIKDEHFSRHDRANGVVLLRPAFDFQPRCSLHADDTNVGYRPGSRSTQHYALLIYNTGRILWHLTTAPMKFSGDSGTSRLLELYVSFEVSQKRL